MAKKCKAPAAETIAKKSEKVAEKQYMYVGVSVISVGLVRHKIYYGRPAIIDTLKTKYPLIEQLFVPIERLNEARIDVQCKSTALYLANQQIINGGEA